MDWYNLPGDMEENVRKSSIQLSVRTRVDIFQINKVGNRGVISGRGSHILKALKNGTKGLILFKEWKRMHKVE